MSRNRYQKPSRIALLVWFVISPMYMAAVVILTIVQKWGYAIPDPVCRNALQIGKWLAYPNVYIYRNFIKQ